MFYHKHEGTGPHVDATSPRHMLFSLGSTSDIFFLNILKAELLFRFDTNAAGTDVGLGLTVMHLVP